VTPYISEMSRKSMSQTNSQSTQAEECGVSKISAESEWSAIKKITQVPTSVRSGNVPKNLQDSAVRGVSVDCDIITHEGTLTLTDGHRILTAHITSEQLRAIADAQDKAVEYVKRLDGEDF